jgi:hypothetical protein
VATSRIFDTAMFCAHKVKEDLIISEGESEGEGEGEGEGEDECGDDEAKKMKVDERRNRMRIG